MAIEVTVITERPNDVLAIVGTNGTEEVRIGTEDDGETPITEQRPVIVRATGWISATTNHFDADAYEAKTGHRKPGAKARAMNEAELRDYALRLLAEQNPGAES